MPKQNLYFILLILPFFLCSQNKQITLTTCSTGEPISFAHFTSQNNKLQAVSNANGQLNLDITALNADDSVEISHIAFKKKRLSIDQAYLPDTICLEPAAYVLNPVNISDVSPEILLSKAVKNSSENLFLPGRLDTYYKEFVKRNGEYTNFADADITYYLERNRKGEVDVQASLKSSRFKELPVAADEFDIDLISPVGHEKTLKYYDPQGIGKFLSEENLKQYAYSLYASDGYYIIEVNPLAESEALYEGTVKIDIESNLLKSVTFRMDDSRRDLAKEVNVLILKMKLLEHTAHIEYEQTADAYYPAFMRLEFRIKTWNDKNINQENTFINDLSVYQIPGNQEPLERKERFRKKSITKNGTDYQTAFWEGKSYLTFTDEEMAILSEMEQ